MSICAYHKVVERYFGGGVIFSVWSDFASGGQRVLHPVQSLESGCCVDVFCAVRKAGVPKAVHLRALCYCPYSRFFRRGEAAMSSNLKKIAVTLLAIVASFILFLTFSGFVIAPYCTEIPQRAEIFKIFSVLAVPALFYVFAWRRNSIAFAILIVVAQISSALAFFTYLNSLPMDCR